MRYFLTFLFLMFLTNTSLLTEPLTGKDKLDSLLTELPKAKGDTNEVSLLADISFSYYTTNPEKGIEYGLKGLNLAKKIDWKQGEATCNHSIGVNYSFGKSKHKEALEYFQKSLKINEEIGNKGEIAVCLGSLGNIYSFLSDYPKSLKYFQKSLRIHEEIGNKDGIAVALNNIGNIYVYQSNYPKAIEYYSKSSKIIKELGNKNNLAGAYNNIAAIYTRQSNNLKALENFKKALEIYEELGNKNGIAKILGNMGVIYRMQSDYPKALEYYHKALKINKSTNTKSEIAINLANIGRLYLVQSQDSIIENSDDKVNLLLNREVNLNKAIEYSNQAKALFKETGLLDYQSQINSYLVEAYKIKGDYKNAFGALKEYDLIQDSIFSQENNDKIAALEKAREDDLKQKEIEKQKIRIAEQEKREKLILYFSIGLVLLMTIVMIVIYRLLKRSDKLLYNVLPVSIAKRLKKKEHPISDYFTQASIVFIDIVNFTEMAQNADPQRLVEALNKIFTKYDTISNKYGLEKIKTIGDSYMAAAGIPEVQKDNTHRAAQMALEVKAMMKDYHTADGTKIEVRIGLDCGPVVAGVIGENKFIYDMWSDAVNTASRMESSSIAGEVHVSERFKEAVTEYEQFDYVERGEIEIKGKGKMKTFFMGSSVASL